MSAALRWLLKPRGDRRWDVFLHGTGVLAALGIPVVLAAPGLAPLVSFLLLAIPANSPLSPVVPVAFEPLIMEVVKYYPALWVSLVSVAIYLYTEYLNWHVYAWVLSWQRFSRLRSRRWVRWGLDRFAAAPSQTVAVFAFTPLPFWVVRAVAILRGYPLKRFLVATALGRFPRYLVYAWAGELLRVPAVGLLAVIVGTTAIVVTWRLARGRRVLAEPVLDPENGSGTDSAALPAADAGA